MAAKVYRFEERPVESRASQTIYAPLISLYVPRSAPDDPEPWRVAVQRSTGRRVAARRLKDNCAVLQERDRFVKGREGDVLVRPSDGERTIIPYRRFKAEYDWSDDRD